MNNYLMAVNMDIVGKDEFALQMSNSKFCNLPDTFDNEQLMEIFGVFGFATTGVLKADRINRNGSNIYGTRIVQLDFDNTWSIEEALAHELYEEYCIGIYTTASDGQVQKPIDEYKERNTPQHHLEVIRQRVGQPMVRFRMVFKTEEMIEAKDINSFYRGLFELFPQADTSCKDTARFFFGSKNARVLINNSKAKDMDSFFVEALIEKGTEIKEAQSFGSFQVDGNGRQLSTASQSMAYGNRFDDNKTLILKNGEIASCDALVQRLNEGYHNRLPCFSPFRREKNPSAFVYKSDKGYLQIYDSATGTKYWYGKK